MRTSIVFAILSASFALASPTLTSHEDRALHPRQSATSSLCCPASDTGPVAYVLDPGTSFPQCGYIGEGNPPSNYETDAGYQGGAAGGCLYDANTGALVTDSDAGYCAQNAITCTVQKRDIAKIALDSKRPSGKLVRDEMSEGMVAMRGIMSSKRRSN